MFKSVKSHYQDTVTIPGMSWKKDKNDPRRHEKSQTHRWRNSKKSEMISFSLSAIFTNYYIF